MSLSDQNLRRWFLLPTALVTGTLILLPLLIVLAYSFLTRGAYGGVLGPVTVESYIRLTEPIYIAIVWRSIWVAALATALCAVLAFPLAFYIAQIAQRRTVLLNLVMLPFWTSFLVRTYAWMFLLRDTGLVNTLLLSTGLIRQPIPLLFNPGAVIWGLVYGYLPFMVLPLYATLEKLDPQLLEAAQDLGASPWQALIRVALPASRPGLIAGCVLVFIPCLGAYLTPDLMGGGRTVMVGNLVQNQFTSARDWPFGAAVSVVFLLLTLLIVGRLKQRGEELL